MRVPLRSRSTLFALALLAFVLLARVFWLVASKDDAGEVVGASIATGVTGSGSGGHEPPDAKAQSVIDSLDPYPGAILDNCTSRGSASYKIGTECHYWVRGTPEEVVTNFIKQMPSKGWSAETPLELERTQPLLDGTSVLIATRTYLKSSYRLTVYAVETWKDPLRGNVKLNIFAEPLG